MPSPLNHLAEASIEPQVFGAPFVVAATTVAVAVSASTWKRAPAAIIRTRLTAPASTKARNVFSFIGWPVEELHLLGDLDARRLAMPADKHLDEIGDAAMLFQGGRPRGLFQRWVDSQVERCGLRRRHDLLSIKESIAM